MTQKTPVTVLTGFLGSGKTTLLNYILSQPHGYKIAVIENEFGEIGIDDALVINSEEEIFEMNNGCICCTVRGDLIRILNRLAKKKQKFDYVLLETTGLADPAPVAQTFFVDEDIAQHFYLDGIVTLVDSKHLIQHLDEVKPDGVENEAVEQIAFADRVLMNKIELINEKQKLSLYSKIKSINSLCPIAECCYSKIDLHFILNLKAFDLNKVLQQEPEFLESHHHQHDLSVTSVALVSEEELDYQKFFHWLRSLLAEKGADMFRTKGIIQVAGERNTLVLQAVHMLLDFEHGALRKKGENSRVIFIGRNLNKEELAKGFNQCKA